VRDRFPLLVVGALVLSAVLGGMLVRGAARGSFADILSTWRSAPDGARALYLLAEESGMRVLRRGEDLTLLEGAGSLVLLAVQAEEAWEEDPEQTALASERDADTEDEQVPRQGLDKLRVPSLSEDEVKALLKHVEAGHSLVYVPWGSREDELLKALQVKLLKAETSLPMRTLVPALSSPFTLGVERVEAKVQAWVESSSDNVLPLLEDMHLGLVAAALVPYGDGRVVVVGAPELAMNQALARADNAQFWLSTLAALGSGPYEFDEYHHGFTNERSVVDFARRYGLQFGVAQLLLGLALWAVSLRRFGRPRPPPQSARVGATDALFAMSRLYREGRHHAFAAGLVLRGLAQELALHAGLPAHAAPEAVAEALQSRGREDLARGLRVAVRQAEAVADERALQQLTTRAADLRRRTHSSQGSQELPKKS
jgi:hypothetical protein